MKVRQRVIEILFLGVIGFCCGSKDPSMPAPPAPSPLLFTTARFDNAGALQNTTVFGVNTNTILRISFNNKVNRSTVAGAITIQENGGSAVGLNFSYENSDSTIVVQPSPSLNYITKYQATISAALKSITDGSLSSSFTFIFITRIDSSRKFPLISDNALLDKVQQQTFKYFWDFAHPVSGLARERNTAGETITSGGSGFGIMAIPVGINRNFITRAEGLNRMQKIVAFLKNTAQKFHGAFPHWLNGTTGVAIPFSQKDDGADLVETSYLMQGLLCARQYFNDPGAAETALRNDINTLWNAVEWSWFRNGGQNVLFWHWSPNYNWDMNLPIKGWNECLITYVLAASSATFAVPAVVYTGGWKTGSNFINGNTYYGYSLPLGPPQGGPLFFSHYSFLGINPNGLMEGGVNYATQTKNHTLINYNYCRANLLNNFGYSDSVWGLTASDIENGYAASSPTNDIGVIAPTAALSSLPYTPSESMAALKFFYYVLGDKIFKEYGFVDAFSLKSPWFATSTLAIDQGPIIVMIENYRTGLLWNLFTSCPEIKNGMKNILGFTAPYL